MRAVRLAITATAELLDGLLITLTSARHRISLLSYSITVYCGIHERIASVFHCRQ